MDLNNMNEKEMLTDDELFNVTGGKKITTKTKNRARKSKIIDTVKVSSAGIAVQEVNTVLMECPECHGQFYMNMQSEAATCPYCSKVVTALG